jgi:hypothetical protein
MGQPSEAAAARDRCGQEYEAAALVVPPGPYGFTDQLVLEAAAGWYERGHGDDEVAVAAVCDPPVPGR